MPSTLVAVVDDHEVVREGVRLVSMTSQADVKLVGPDVRVATQGDRVLFLPSSGLEVELDGQELVLLRERDVQAVSSPPAAGTRSDRAPGQYL